MPAFIACTQQGQEAEAEGEIQVVANEELPVQPLNEQILVVETADWDAVQGTLTRYEYVQREWQQAGAPINIVVGKKGMGWGKGVRDYRNMGEPVKREGDRKSPAGIFKLGTAFGYAAPAAVVDLDIPYVHVTETIMCIEDGDSKVYNQIIDEAAAQPDWNSTDHMLRKDDLYEWGLFVAHNSPEAEAGSGSCIFLHVWRRHDSGTAGCTAMDKAEMLNILQWLDSAKHPVMVQYPAVAKEKIEQVINIPKFSLD